MNPRTSVTLALGLAVLALGLSTPAHANDAAAAEAAFQKFANSWVADLESHAKGKRAGANRYTAYDPKAVEISLKPTGNAAAPFVGTLTYTEHVYQCRSAEQRDCEKVESAPVTEIFPYQGGKWRY